MRPRKCAALTLVGFVTASSIVSNRSTSYQVIFYLLNSALYWFSETTNKLHRHGAHFHVPWRLFRTIDWVQFWWLGGRRLHRRPGFEWTATTNLFPPGLSSRGCVHQRLGSGILFRAQLYQSPMSSGATVANFWWWVCRSNPACIICLLSMVGFPEHSNTLLTW